MFTGWSPRDVTSTSTFQPSGAKASARGDSVAPLATLSRDRGYTVQEPYLEAFAPVVARLAGK
jgi:hypothetical protein